MSEIYSCERPELVCPFCAARQTIIKEKHGEHICENCGKSFEFFSETITLYSSKPVWMKTEQWSRLREDKNEYRKSKRR